MSVGNLPRVFVKILAMGDEDQVAVRRRAESERAIAATGDPLAEHFARALDWPKAERAVVARRLDAALDLLLDEDFFGSEGQCDPRGDRRDD